MTSTPLNIVITVVNVNEHHPEFPQASDSVSIPENATLLSEVYRATATDSDYGNFGRIVYVITAGDFDGSFGIAEDTGIISLAKELDREGTPNGYELTIEARGFSGAAAGDSMVLRVNISDINDNSPQFSAQVSGQTVSETAVVGDVIIQVGATDSDLGINGQVSFGITAGNTEDLFEIDSETGKIEVKQSLDLEGNDPPQHLNYTLTIEARDGGVPTQTTTMDVDISITPENEFTPEFSNVNDTIQVMENVSVSSEIYQANATDKDYGVDGELEYSITAQNPSGYFNMDSAGSLTVAQALDREVTPNGIILTIQAADKPATGTAKSSTMQLTVHITDYNDNSPGFTTQISPQEVSERASVGDVIVQVEATDADLGTNADVSYSITAGNSDDLFEIDGETGEIKVKKSLDLEENDPPQYLNYTLTIEARDGGVPTQTTTMVVDISITPENEFTPEFSNVNDTIQVTENTSVSSEIYQANATDKDYGVDGELVYSITGQNPSGYFNMDSEGSLTVAQALDREVTPNGIIILTIKATDKPATGTAKSSTMQLTVQITDYNDNSPGFTTQVSPQNVSEGASVGDVIVQVEATDADLGTNADVSYSITAGNSDDLFEIDGETGEIKVKKSLDLEGNDPPQYLNYTLTIEARDGGVPTQTTTMVVDISITPENEFTPEFSNVNDTIQVTENTSVSSEIYQANATDKDYGVDGELEYSITAQDPSGYFNMDTAGSLTVAQTLDREATSNGIILTIQATDKPATGTAKSSTMQLTVQITDYNDNSPGFTTQVSPQNVSEGASVGDVIVQVGATDADLGMNANISYSITAGNSDDLFEIDGETGEIKVKKSLDLEGNDPPQYLNYSLTIEARDGGVPTQTTTMVVDISITPENEFTPEFSNVNDTIQVMENTSVSSEIYQANATDKDYGVDGELEYSITAQKPSGYFNMDSAGSLTVAQALDREVTPNGIILTIKAADKPATGTAKSSTMQLTVQITDYNDNSPGFITQVSPQNVSERASVGDVIVQVGATDADLGTNADVSYGITAGNSDDLFEIDGETGEIKVKKSLDLEGNDPPQSLSYTLTIEASDGGSPARDSTMNVQISILPENEFTPQFASSSDTIQVSEGISESSEVYVARATDGDAGTDGQIVYSITSESPVGYFIINDVSGQVTVAKALDRETMPDGVNLTIQAADQPNVGASRTAWMVLSIVITDVNDEEPMFGAITSQEVPEDAAVGTVITQVQATDADIGENARISYSITGGNSLGFFGINSVTGEVNVAKSLDLETASHAQGLSYTLAITATDSGVPSRSASQSLSITVTSVNEFTPAFDKDVEFITVAHNSPVSDVVYEPQAEDQDFGTDGELQYTMTSPNNDGYFTINQNNGQVSVAKTLNLTAVPINITITATDQANQGAPKTASMLLSIEVIYVDNVAPVFSANIPDNVSIAENATVDTLVLGVQAADTDLGPNGMIKYSIVSGNQLGFFKINEDSGALTVNQSLDLETKTHAANARYALTIQAEDQGTPPLSSTKVVTVQVSPVNEFTPRFSNAISPQVLREDTLVNTPVVQVIAEDQDSGDDGRLSYSIVGGNGGGYFVINTTTGKLAPLAVVFCF